MSVESQDSGMLQRALDLASQNLTIERLLIRLGLDPSNITYDAILDRLIDIALANITLANLLGLIGGIFLISTFVVRTIVPLRVLCIISSVFLLGAAMLSGSVPHFFLYLLVLPISIIRLVQIRNLVKKARSAARGDLSLDWLRPYMMPRDYRKGDVLFRKGDAATEMFLTVSGKFLVTEIGIEIPPGRVMGELGFLSPKNHRTQSVECTEDGEVLTIAYEKLLEVYFQKPEFGYYFLRLTSDRLMQNFARLEALIERDRAEKAGTSASDPNQASGTGMEETTRAKRVLSTIRDMRPSWPGANQRRASAAAAAAELEKQKAAAALEAGRRRLRARAIVERHANYSALGGFIPVPVANVAAITAVIMRMVRSLSELYGVSYDRSRAHALVIGLMGGVMPTGLATVATSIVVLRAGLQPDRACGLVRDRIGLCPQGRRHADRPLREWGDAGAGSFRFDKHPALEGYFAFDAKRPAAWPVGLGYHPPRPIAEHPQPAPFALGLGASAGDPLEARPHLLLRLGEVRVERGEVRQVRRPRQQAEQSRARGLRIERAGQAQPQDLREIVIERRGRPQHVGLLGRQQAEPPGLVQHPRRRGVENFRLLGGVDQLQVLRDELQVDQPARRVFEVPARAFALFGGDGAAHVGHVLGDHRGIARCGPAPCGSRPRPRRRIRATPKRPAPASAPCAPRSRPRSS